MASLRNAILLLSALAVSAGAPVAGAGPDPPAAGGGSPVHNPADSRKRFLLLDSTGTESDVGQAVVLRDRVTGEVIILADPGDGGGLREISRGRSDEYRTHVSILPVGRDRYYLVVFSASEFVENETEHVTVEDPATGKVLFSGRSRLPPMIEDMNGDGAGELVLFIDPYGIEDPNAPVWPVVHALDQNGLLQRRPPGDPAYRAFMETTAAEFERFLHRLESDCEGLERKKIECFPSLKDDIAKARKQLQDIRQVLGR